MFWNTTRQLNVPERTPTRKQLLWQPISFESACQDSTFTKFIRKQRNRPWAFFRKSRNLSWIKRELFQPRFPRIFFHKAETAVHGWHCPGDMAVRMRKRVLARQSAPDCALVFECSLLFLLRTGTASGPKGEFWNIIILVNSPNVDFVLHSQIQLTC